MPEQIQKALNAFSSGNLTENARNFFKTLGYESERRLPFENKSFEDFEGYITVDSRFIAKNALTSEWRYVDLLFQLTESELSEQNLLFDADKSIDQRITSYLFFVIELTEANYSRTKLSQITREVNKVFQIPAMILFKYGEHLTLSIIDRQPHKRDESKDVLRKVTLIKDINFRSPHRAHLEFLKDLSVPELNERFSIKDFLDLHNAWQKKLDVELVTNRFFREYKVVFDKVEAEVEKHIVEVETARLFTQRLFNRLMFIYFIQKKGWMTFGGSKDYLRSIFDTSNKAGEDFYRDRLYWVFFFGLSNVGESTEVHESKELEEKRGLVPYLNGGLFEMEEDGLDDKNKVPLPNSLFADILNLFEHYNFTVEESTPLEVQVAIDPEILGRVFEELVTGRHETGSYYTPRQIVSFMCRESLKYYLAPHDTAETIAQFVDDGNGESLANPENILEQLQKIRVCDPACGSGAYLLGMLQELLRLREALFTSKHVGDATQYDRKRAIIENNIYGVDKDRFAVQIASLRLWLSLAIESADPHPLPNLKYKIGCGDALLAPLEDDLQPNLHRTALIEQFRARKAEYAKAFNYIEKRGIDNEVERLRVEIAQSLHHLPEPPKPHKIILAESQVEPLQEKVQRLVKAGDKSQAEKFQKDLIKLEAQIQEWKRQIDVEDYKPAFFDWTVEFAEVFSDGGFDVVLANPPYIRMELFKPIKPVLRINFPNVHSDRADLYVYFFARAIQLLKENGVGTFISSNKWLKSGYGEPLRRELLDSRKFHLVADFGDLPVFNATAYASIFIWQNSARRDSPTRWALVTDLDNCYREGVQSHISKIAEVLPASQFGVGKPRITSTSDASFRELLLSHSVTLSEYTSGQIYYGIKTGLNEAFVIGKEIRDRLMDEDKNSAEIIKPLLEGTNVRRYEIHSRKTYLIYTRHGVNIGRYPAIENHLRSYRGQLEDRATEQAWYELQQPQYAYAASFETSKIVYPDIGKYPRFAMDFSASYGSNTFYAIPREDWYLLGILNSSFTQRYLDRVSTKIRGGYVRFIYQNMEGLPIPVIQDSERGIIAKCAKETHNLHQRRRAKVEEFLGSIGVPVSTSTSRNVLEKPWNLSEEEFVRRTHSRFNISIFRDARDETLALTEETNRIEREIDERVADLYGVKLDTTSKDAE